MTWNHKKESYAQATVNAPMMNNASKLSTANIVGAY